MKNKPLRGEKLAKIAVNQILAHPNTWDQACWHAGEGKNGCHTVHCIGGWIQVLGGRQESVHNVISDVSELLGISLGDALWLCDGVRSLSDIYFFVKNLPDDGFDRDGRDVYGFDRDGRDVSGFDRDGFGRDGRDVSGFDRDGRDVYGFDRDGFDRAGKKLKPFEI